MRELGKAASMACWMVQYGPVCLSLSRQKYQRCRDAGTTESAFFGWTLLRSFLNCSAFYNHNSQLNTNLFLSQWQGEYWGRGWESWEEGRSTIYNFINERKKNIGIPVLPEQSSTLRQPQINKTDGQNPEGLGSLDRFRRLQPQAIFQAIRHVEIERGTHKQNNIDNDRPQILNIKTRVYEVQCRNCPQEPLHNIAKKDGLDHRGG